MSDVTEKKEGEVVEAAQYVGPRKVSKVVAEDFKTYGGKETVTVHYEGGFSEFMPKAAFEIAVTDAPTDFTALAKRVQAVILKDLMAVLAEHDVKGGEIEMITKGLGNEMFNAFNKATHLLWTKGDSNNFTPGSNTVLERSLLEADRVIKSYPDTVKSDGPEAAN